MTDHHEGDQCSPMGVFTLSDAGGVLDSPGVNALHEIRIVRGPPQLKQSVLARFRLRHRHR